MSGRRIAVLSSEGQHAKWPADLEVKCYASTARDAAKVAAMMKGKTVDAVIIANKNPNHNVIRLMPKNCCPVHLWKGSLPALSSSLHDVVGLPKLAVPPAVEEKPDKRDPKWTPGENDSILLAISECNDSAEMFHAVYNELEARERTAGELWCHADELRRRGFLRVTDAFMLALRSFAETGQQAAATAAEQTAPVGDMAAFLKKAVALGVLTADEAIDRALALARHT